MYSYEAYVYNYAVARVAGVHRTTSNLVAKRTHRNKKKNLWLSGNNYNSGEFG